LKKDIKEFPVLFKPTNFFLSIILLLFIILSFNHFLLFHTLVEIFSVVVAFIIFVLTIYTYDKIENNFFIIIGLSYGFIGFFDLLHTLAYKGMNIFVNTGSDLPTQLWIMTRYLESVLILVALYFLGSKVKCDNKKIIYGLMFLSFLLLSSLYFEIFPTAYIAGEGLTLFKIISEYIISGILLLNIFLLQKKKEYFTRYIYKLILISLILTIISEISFTFYIDVYGLSNIIGHIFKVISVILIFKAIIETGLKAPFDVLYRELKSRKDQLHDEKQFIDSIYNNIEQVICVNELVYDKDGQPKDYKIVDTNDAYEKIFNLSPKEVKKKLGSKLYYEKDNPSFVLYQKTVNQRETIKFEKYYQTLDKYFNITATPLNENLFITLFEDISELKEKELELKNKYREVQKLNNNLESLIYITNRLSITSSLDQNDFLKDVLEIAMELIEHADYGSISVYEQKEWTVLDSYGYEEGLINELNLNRDMIYKNGENIFKVDLIKMNNKETLKTLDENRYPVEMRQTLEKISKKIKESIFFELDLSDNKRTRISLDISAKSKQKFSKNDKKILNALRNLIYVFLNLNIRSGDTDVIEYEQLFED